MAGDACLTRVACRCMAWPWMTAQSPVLSISEARGFSRKTIVIDANGKTKVEPKPTYTNANLPFPPERFTRDLVHFRKTVIPDAVDWVATLDDVFAAINQPEFPPTAQDIWRRYFSAYTYTEAVEAQISSAIGNWRSDIGKKALHLVIEHLNTLPSIGERRNWVAKQSHNLAFLYRDPATKTGSYRSDLFLKTFAVHLRIVLKSDVSYGHPVGAAALTAAAIERALSICRNGAPSKDALLRQGKKAPAFSFGSVPWAERAASYLKPIKTLSLQKWCEIIEQSRVYVKGRGSSLNDIFESSAAESSDGYYVDPREQIVISDDEPEQYNASPGPSCGAGAVSDLNCDQKLILGLLELTQILGLEAKLATEPILATESILAPAIFFWRQAWRQACQAKNIFLMQGLYHISSCSESKVERDCLSHEMRTKENRNARARTKGRVGSEESISDIGCIDRAECGRREDKVQRRRMARSWDLGMEDDLRKTAVRSNTEATPESTRPHRGLAGALTLPATTMRVPSVLALWRLFLPAQLTPLDGRHSLPMELWNLVFLHLEDETLLDVAAVCRPFNELSIPIVLLTNDVTRSDITSGDYAVPSRLLPLLLRALFIPTIKDLFCVFEKSDLSRHLRLLSALVARSTSLSSLDLRFPLIPRTGWLLDTSVCPVFCEVLSAMLSRTPRDIILVSERHCVRCSLRDLFTYLIFDDSMKVSGRRRFPMAAITSLKVHFQRRRSGGLRPFTMLVVNASTVENTFRSLELGSWPEDSGLSVAHLSAILSKLILPHLQTVNISAPHVDPGALSDFLTRHPQVECICDTWWPSAPSQRKPLLQLPLSLPRLRKIDARTPTNLLALLVGTAPSLPRTIGITFPEKEDPAFAAVFRFLCERNIPTELEIFADCDVAPEFTETDFALARSLHCVDAVYVKCVFIKNGAVLFPWLNALPALSTVEFGSGGWSKEEDDLPFLTLARASLVRPGMDIQVDVSRRRR
ncbi:hypothetical protein C8R45DRAFT_1164724 [Mycena sanguinolenta]|nr:hypothetical protein C8R45DRAFT_1164724 [Mycena sanguinolenta]